MKNAFQMILALTVVGLIALMAAAFYFGAPLFGWVIMVAIFAVFIGEQLVALKTVKQVAAENEASPASSQAAKRLSNKPIL